MLAAVLAPTTVAAQQTVTAERVAVDSVAIDGLDRLPLSEVLGLVGILPGDSIGPVEVDRAMRRLFASGQFSDVSVVTESDPADASVPVLLRVVVVEQPIVGRIEFRGLENVSGTHVRDTVGLVAGGPYRPSQAVRAEAVTRQMLGQKGFQVRSISHRLEPVPERPNESVLVFDVVEGNRVALTDIAFEGNEHFSDSQLRSEMGMRTEGFLWYRPGTYTEEQLREDLRGTLPDFYAQNGFIDFAVLGDSLVVDDETGKARMIVTVAEGDQYRIAEFDVRGASRFASSDLRMYFEQRRSGFLGGFGIGGGRDRGTQAGEVFDRLAFDAATLDVQRLYTNQGYLYAQINPVIERVGVDSAGEPLVRVAWEIREGEPALVRHVTITGNTHTHENVIRSQILMLPGDVYSEERLLQSYQRIGATGFFETPMPLPQISDTAGSGEVDITFQVTEKQTGSVGFGTSLGGTIGLMGFLSYDEPNLFGRAKAGRLRWEFGRYSNNFEASYSDPAIAESMVSGSVSLFSSADRFYTFSEGRRRRTGAGLRVGLPVPGDQFSRFTFGYQLARTAYENFEDDPSSLFSLPPGIQSTVSLGVQRMALDHPMFPTVGSRQEFDAALSGGPLGGDGEFQKYTMSGAWYVPVGTLGGEQPGTRPIRTTLGLTVEAGALFGDASGFPFERFWMGGVQFGRPLRGYDETTITPRGYIPENAPNVDLTERFGDAYLRLSAEYAIRFTDNISTGLFFDAGNVWRNPSEMNPSRLLRGAGIGMMLVTPFGPLGLDYAYGFDKDQPGWQMHFKFGQGF